MSDKYLTVTEMANMLGYNRMTIIRHIQTGKLKAFRVGRKIFTSPEFFQEYLDKSRIKVTPKSTETLK